MYKIFLSNRDKNINAIGFYISIIEESIEQAGHSCKRVNKISDVEPQDTIITLDVHSFYTVWRNNKKQKIANWFQGVAPEEIYYRDNNIKGYLKMKIWNYFEKIAITHSYLNFFVSNEMVRHYKVKFGYDKDNYIVMPCFNQYIHPECFVQSKYNRPSFIYTGSLLKWQCFDETLDLFCAINKKIPSASLSVITGDVEEAKCKIENRGLKNIEVKSIPYNKLDEEMPNYKYGFLIRQDMLINNVATPTKMSSYLAGGLIPVYSTVIRAFDENLCGLKFVIKDNGNMDDVVNQIVELERHDVNSSDILKEYSDIFSSFYSKERYVKTISKVI